MSESTPGLICPACRVDLVMSERQGVEIDYCPKCRGVWLDRGELDKILERSAAEFAPPPQAMPQAAPPTSRPEYQRDYDRDRDHRYDDRHQKHHKHRPRSFLHDLFD